MAQVPAVHSEWTHEDLRELLSAVDVLERPSLPMKLTNLLGTPIEYLVSQLPANARQIIHTATDQALRKAMNSAVDSIRPWHTTAIHAHRGFAGLTGGVGGLLGLPGLAVELPVTTVIMLRAIAAVARDEGEDLDALEARLSCLSVFALASRTHSDDAAESSYFIMRGGLALMVSEATTHISTRGLVGDSLNPIVRLLAAISRRFGVAVTQKLAAQTVPIVGGVGGASINLLFTSHFQTVARGHFTVRRLERKYGRDEVQSAYQRMREQLKAQSHQQPHQSYAG